MRRSDREIKDFNEVADVLRRADTIRLGINGKPFPYVVPLSFGFTAENGGITIYIHGAGEGFKHDLLKEDNNVCVETDIFHRYAQTETSITAEYESVIGFGKAEIADMEEAEKGMGLLLEHCGFPGYDYNKKALERTRVYKITLESFTGKRRVTG